MSKYQFDDVTMLKPDEVQFLERYCGLDFTRIKEIVGEGQLVPFWGFTIYDRELTDDDVRVAYEIEEREGR